ncbi:MAG: DUF1573 domain-containing protein [Sphingobacteriales bacterium]|nr:DUF1573 domain-containing protein [Sphingobacteriales bacterium]
MLLKIKNPGHTPLKIEQIIFSCDCVLPLYKDTANLLGDIKSIDFAINSESFNKGYNERVFTLFGNFRPFFKFRVTFIKWGVRLILLHGYIIYRSFFTQGVIGIF